MKNGAFYLVLNNFAYLKNFFICILDNNWTYFLLKIWLIVPRARVRLFLRSLFLLKRIFRVQ